jgi:low temperature requirement protein LtrA
MTRFTLFGAGLMMLVVGMLHLLAPQMMMKEPGIALETVNHLHVVRAAYGGAYLGIAALFLAGAFRVVDTRAALSAVAIIFGGFALGRLVSLVADGLPVPLYLGVLGAELLFTTCAVLALRRAPAGGARGGY